MRGKRVKQLRAAAKALCGSFPDIAIEGRHVMQIPAGAKKFLIPDKDHPHDRKKDKEVVLPMHVRRNDFRSERANYLALKDQYHEMKKPGFVPADLPLTRHSQALAVAEAQRKANDLITAKKAAAEKVSEERAEQPSAGE